MFRSILLVSTLAVGLSACNTVQGNRALTGGLIGGGVGAVVGGVATHSAGGALAGGAIGAAGGALIGAATTPRYHRYHRCYYSRYYGHRVCR